MYAQVGLIPIMRVRKKEERRIPFFEDFRKLANLLCPGVRVFQPVGRSHFFQTLFTDLLELETDPLAGLAQFLEPRHPTFHFASERNGYVDDLETGLSEEPDR